MKEIKLLKSLHIEKEEGNIAILKGKYYIANYYTLSNKLYLFNSGIKPSDVSRDEILNIIHYITSIYENVKIEIL